MANEKRLIDANALQLEPDPWGGMNGVLMLGRSGGKTMGIVQSALRKMIDNAPTVDAVVLPKGKPGDYLEWDNGTGFKQIYCIGSVMICEDCMRYELANFTPVVNHPGIVRIMSREEAEKEWHEQCARDRAKEEPNLKACAMMDGDGNVV